ncbi:MAG: rod shape-determining protein MreD [Acidobacteriota bacterium]|jgi:rod shape-determining protein MreD
MRKPYFAIVVVFALALGLQLLLFPLFTRNLNSVNAFLALLVVMALRYKKLGGVICGAALGGLSDILFMQHLGYHGIAFTIVGYLLGLISNKMVIRGLGPVFLFTLLACLLEAGMVTLLYTLFEHALPWSALWPPIAVSCALTPFLAVGLQFVHVKLAGEISQ